MKELEKKIKLLESEIEQLKSELSKKNEIINSLKNENPKLENSRQKSVDDLKESEEKFLSLFNNKHTTMLILNPETGDILDANPAACNYYKYSHDEITKLKITNINFSNSEYVFTVMQSVKLEQQQHFNFKHKLKSGEIRDVEVFSWPIKMSGQKLLFSIINDITEQNKIEEALKESEIKFRTLINSLRDGIIVAKDGTFVLVNPAYAHMVGYKNPEELIGTPIISRAAPEDRELIAENMRRRALGEEVPTLYVSRALSLDGTITPIEMSVSTYNLNNELYTLAVVRDITYSKNAELSLRESEAKYKMLTDLSGDMIVMHRNFKKNYVNPAVENILGYKQEEFLHFSFLELLHPDDRNLTEKNIKKDIHEKIEKNYLSDFRLKHKNGKYIWFSAQIIVHKFGENEFITIINLRDITQKVLADTQIRKLSVAINQSPATIVISDTNGNIEYVNPQFSIITGYTSEEAIGKNPKILKTDYHDAEFYKNMWETIKSGNTWKGEFYNLRKDGSKYWEDAIIAPIFNEKDEIVNYVAIKQDITLRKEAEFKVMQQNIQLNELVRTKDKFITILAHDLKNPFNAILGSSELLSENFDEYSKEKIKEFTDMIHVTAKNTYNLLKNLLEWAHSQQNRISYKPEKANLLSITNECYYLVQSNALAKGIKINVEVPKEIFVYADKEMIKTVLRNLMTNSIKFTKKNGNIYIKVKSYDSKVEVIVSDTGVGMSERTKNSLFKIGETISENGTEGERGTGFGLMICKEFIDKNGGEIWVESELGKGSDFKFTLSNYTEK